MVRRFLLQILIGISCLFEIQAQKIIVESFMPSTVLIQYSSGGNASGVVIGDSSYLYLVTARHCLISDFKGCNINLVDSTALLIYYVEDPYSTKPDTILVNLVTALQQKDLLFDTLNDIAILAIAKMDGFTVNGNLKFNYTSCTQKLTKWAPGGFSNNLFLDYDKVDVGDDCIILGYPSSLRLNSFNDYDFNRPLLRKGAIAGKDKLKGTIIVDCPSYQGNSGGPVFNSSILPNVNIGIIGIVSRSILHVEQLESNYYKTTVSVNYNNSGYTVIIPINFANALMKRRRLN